MIQVGTQSPYSSAKETLIKNGAKCDNNKSVIQQGSFVFVCKRIDKQLRWRLVPISANTEYSSAFNNLPMFSWMKNALAMKANLPSDNEVSQIDAVHISPNFPTAISTGLLEYQKIATNYWRNFGVSIPGKLEVVMLTEKDSDWFNSEINIAAPVVKSFFDHGDTSRYFNGTVIVDRVPASRFLIVYFVGTRLQDVSSGISGYRNWQTALSTTALHEYQHLVQFSKTLTTNKGNLQSKLSCWFNEGMAAFYELNFFVEDFGSNKSLKMLQTENDTRMRAQDNRFNRISNVKAFAKRYNFNLQNVESWQAFLDEGKLNNSEYCLSRRYGYTVGFFIFEELFREYGTSGILSLIENHALLGEFAGAFRQTFGMSEDDWLKQRGIPHLIEQIS